MATLTSLIVRVAGDNADLERTLGETPRMVDKIGSRISQASSAIGLAAGGAMTAGLLGAVDAESAGDKLVAQLGATGDRADELARVQGAVFAAGWGDSLDDVGLAVQGVVNNIGDLGEGAQGGLEGLTTKALGLAQVFGVDLSEATAAAGNLLRTGLATDADAAFDVVTAGLQSGADKAGDFLATLNEYAPQWQKFGLDAQTATGLLSQGLRAGARDSDLVADAIKEFSIRAVDGSQTTKSGFDAIGLSAEDMAAKIAAGGPTASAALDLTLDRLRAIEDPVARSAAAVALFGTQAEDLGASLYALDPSTAVAALGQVQGAADSALATVSDNPAAAFETFKRTAQQKLTEIAGSFASFAMANQGAVMPLVIALGALAGVITLARVGMMAWTAATTAWTAVQKVATAAQWLWDAAITANPLTLWIVAIAAVVAGVILLYTKCDTARAIINAAFSGIWSAIKFVWDWVSQHWPLLLSILTGPIGAAVIFIVQHWDQVKAGGEKVWNWLQALPGKIRGALAPVGEIITAPFRFGFNAIARLWNSSVGRIGFSVPGWVPGVGGKSFSIPKIPLLESGGLVTSTGLAVVHRREAVLPAGTAPLPPGARGGGGDSRAVLELRSSGSRVDDMLLELLRAAVKSRGGDVQAVVGA